MTSEQLAELRRVAEAMPEHEWEVVKRHMVRAITNGGLHAEFIAAFDPPTVLALLDEIERLQGGRCQHCKELTSTEWDDCQKCGEDAWS